MGQLLCALIKSSIGRKFIMAITGLGAIGFLTVHLGGNLVVYAGKDWFNSYAEHLHKIPFLFVFEALLFAMFAMHIVFASILTIHNWQSRRISYSMRKTAGGSNLASSTMIYSGLAVLFFMIIHLITIKTGHANMGSYERVVHLLSHPHGAITYVLGVLALGLHLFHGASSTFQSIGINHPKYANVITFVGRTAAVIMAAAFSSIPLYAWIVLSKG